MASTIANIVSMLMEKPNRNSTKNVPSSTTGTAMVGIRVARRLPMNSHMIRNTSTTASKSVLTTSLMATLVKGVVS
jgi:hypothetical protein